MKNLTVINNLPPASQNTILDFEKVTGFTLPDDYKKFLNKVNVISVRERIFRKDNTEFWLDVFYPLNKNYDLSLEFVYNHLDVFFGHKYLAFANDAGGWQYVLSLDEKDYGKVYFCRMDEELGEGFILLADSFEEFINGLEAPTLI